MIVVVLYAQVPIWVDATIAAILLLGEETIEKVKKSQITKPGHFC